MRSAALPLLLFSLTVGCSSNTLSVIPPEIAILPVDFGTGRPPTLGQFSVTVPVSIVNRSLEPLLLERIDISSVGTGVYSVASTMGEFKTTIPPGERSIVDVWVQIRVVPDSVAAADGALNLRGIAYFKAADESFRRIFVQRVTVDDIARGIN